MGTSEKINHDNPKISPKYRASDYLSLNLNGHINENWNKATKIFKDRLEGRFIAPVDAIVNHTTYIVKEFSGFAILSIDCLIIETLNQFYKGIDETTGDNWKAFRDFFQRSKYFMKEFPTNKICKIFYSHFRCGLLHQAQTKKQSKIRYNEKRMVQPVDSTDIDKGLIVDRKLFHDAIKIEIEDYITALESPTTAEDETLRVNFVKKMDFITKQK
jgi:hypothetical protein